MLLLVYLTTLIIATISTHEEQTEKLDSPITDSGEIEVNGETIQYNIQDNEYIVEGDIIITPVSDERRRLVPVIDPLVIGPFIIGGEFWRNDYVPYEIHSQLSSTMVSRIKAAISHWERNTNIRFGIHNGERDYVQFVPANGCASRVGRIGGAQEIKLSDRCQRGNIIHEIGHAIGFFHTHSREDRNLHIEVHWDNIIENRKSNFNRHILFADDCLSYDYGSIMHYGRFFFAIDKSKPTITPLRSGVTIGQRDSLSYIDILCARRAYPHLKCITSCKGMANGNYHSCKGCNVYATCCEEMLIDGRPCAAGHLPLEYDYLVDRCVYGGESQTCDGSQSAKAVLPIVLGRDDFGVHSSVEKTTNSMFGYIFVTGLILFILVNNIFIAFWCLRKAKATINKNSVDCV